MKKIINKLDIILLTLFVIFFISFALSYKLQLFVIYSGSMEPHIPKGSIVFTIKPEQNHLSSYKKGDIITFGPYQKEPNSFITHRIYKINNNQIFTKGDFNKTIDSWTIQPNQIKGLYLFHIPFLGYGLHFLILYPWYLLIILGILCTFPYNIKNETINWSFINKITIFILPLIVILWSLPAYAQFNSTSCTNNNSFSTDTFNNYISLINKINTNDNNSFPDEIQKDLVLDLGNVDKKTNYYNVLEIRNTSLNSIKLSIIDKSPYITSLFSTNNKQTINLKPFEITRLTLKIKKKNFTENTDSLKLQINNSDYYISTIKVNF